MEILENGKTCDCPWWEKARASLCSWNVGVAPSCTIVQGGLWSAVSVNEPFPPSLRFSHGVSVMQQTGTETKVAIYGLSRDIVECEKLYHFQTVQDSGRAKVWSTQPLCGELIREHWPWPCWSVHPRAPPVWAPQPSYCGTVGLLAPSQDQSPGHIFLQDGLGFSVGSAVPARYPHPVGSSRSLCLSWGGRLPVPGGRALGMPAWEWAASHLVTQARVLALDSPQSECRWWHSVDSVTEVRGGCAEHREDRGHRGKSSRKASWGTIWRANQTGKECAFRVRCAGGHLSPG